MLDYLFVWFGLDSRKDASLTSPYRNPMTKTSLDWTDEMVADFREYNEEVQRVFPRCGIRKFYSVAVSIHVSSTSDSPNLTCKLMSEANLAMTKFSNGNGSRRGFLTMFYLQMYKANALFLDKAIFLGNILSTDAKTKFKMENIPEIISLPSCGNSILMHNHSRLEVQFLLLHFLLNWLALYLFSSGHNESKLHGADTKNRWASSNREVRLSTNPSCCRPAHVTWGFRSVLWDTACCLLYCKPMSDRLAEICLIITFSFSPFFRIFCFLSCCLIMTNVKTSKYYEILNWCKTLELITLSFLALLVTCRLCRFIKCCTAWFLFRSPIMNKIIDYKTVFHLMENTYLNAELPRKKGFLVVTCQDTTTFRIILNWIVTSVSHAL